MKNIHVICFMPSVNSNRRLNENNFESSIYLCGSTFLVYMNQQGRCSHMAVSCSKSSQQILALQELDSRILVVLTRIIHSVLLSHPIVEVKKKEQHS